MRQQRLLHSGVTADQQDSVASFEFFDGGSEPREERRLGIRPEIDLCQPMIDVTNADATENPVGQEIILGQQRCREQGPDPLRTDPRQLPRDASQRLFPTGVTPLPVLANTGTLQPLRPIQTRVAVPVPIGNPGFIDRLVFTRNHPHDPTLMQMHERIGTHGIVRSHGRCLLILPGASDKAGRLGGQRADRAKIDDISGQLVTDRIFDVGTDAHELPASGSAEFTQPGDFLGEAYAARAMNAARHLRRDQRPDVLVGNDTFHLRIPGDAFAVPHGHVLQFALTALVANRTIERVIDQEKLHRALLRLQRQRRRRVHLHSRHDRCRAGRQGLWCLLDLDQTHPAIGRDRELLVIAEPGDMHPDSVSHFDQHCAFRRLDHLTIDLDRNRIGG